MLCIAVGTTAIVSEGSSRENRPKRTLQIEAKRFEFNPNTIVLKRGERVQLRLTAADGVQHGVRIPDLGVDMVIPPGKTAEVVLQPAKVGTFVGRCSVYCGGGHKSMAITVEVHR